jgi:radical SAM protein with 4Fe4S-binding SPASM domain
MGAFSTLSGTALSAAQIRPILEMAEPFLKTAPETSDGKEVLTSIKGGIELEFGSKCWGEDGGCEYFHNHYIDQPVDVKCDCGHYMYKKWTAGNIDARISHFMEYNPECQECKWKTACCGGCRAVAVRDHPLDYLAPDLLTCHYFKDGWKDRKDEMLRSIGHL